jgi:methyl-accepting chemotaxis protein
VRCSSISNTYTAIVEGQVAQAQQVRVLQVTFKKQVQAWKDILLRGRDDAALAKYDHEFHSLQQEVSRQTDELIAKVDDVQVQQDLTDFRARHAALDLDYENALAGYRASRDFAPADAALKGKDRPPTDSLDRITEKLTSTAVALPAQEAARTRRETRLLIAVLVFLWVSIAAWCVAYARNLGVRLGNCVRFVQSIASGDLTQQATEHSRSDELGLLVLAMTHMRDQMNTIILAIQTVADDLATSADTVSTSSHHIAQAASQQRDHAAQVASALEEMIASVREVTHHCGQAALQASKTEGLALDSQKSVAAVAGQVALVSTDAQRNAETVSDLGRRSSKIGQIVTLIEEIAGQTNLLALNAAIESARAGEQGRGFAVVAGEVRRLAERTTSATREIGGAVQSIQHGTLETVEHIRTSSGQVEQSVSTANDAANLLQTLGGSTQEMRQMIDQIAQATEEQSLASTLVGKSMHEIAESILKSAEGARQTDAAAERLVSLSAQLTDSTRRFKTTGTAATTGDRAA